jgi:hypothetical protein
MKKNTLVYKINYSKDIFLRGGAVAQNGSFTITAPGVVHTYNVPNALPATQSWLYCPIIFMALALIDPTVTVVQNNIPNLNAHIQTIRDGFGMDPITFDQIIAAIRVYLVNSEINSYADFQIRYINGTEEPWHHPSGTNQEIILQNAGGDVQMYMEELVNLLIQ